VNKTLLVGVGIAAISVIVFSLALTNPNLRENKDTYFGFIDTKPEPVHVYVIIPKGSANADNQSHLIPEEITVVLGKNNTVTWINEDSVPRTLVSDDKNYPWSTGLMNPGESSSVTFDKTGVFSYHGNPGPWITGSVIVVEEN
jgi:plastocyanin